MLPKIKLDKFREIKNRLQEKLEYLQKKYEDVDVSKLTKEEEQKMLEEITTQYCSVQNEIFNYDLSDIPFEEWEEMTLMSTDVLDLSKTHANIDFSLLDVSCEKGINLKGCNVKHLEYAFTPLYEHYVDQHMIDENPTLFLSNKFSEDLKIKFATSKLSIEDLINLTDEQIIELECPNALPSVFSHTVQVLGVVQVADL